MFPSYAELHCLTNFTFLRSASHPEEMVARAQQLGYAGLAITDECSVAGVVRAHLQAKQCGLKLIVGAEFRLSAESKVVLLAQNRAGYGNLSELITRARRKAKKGDYFVTPADFESGLQDCLALLIPLAQPDAEEVRWLMRHFPQRAWLAVELLLAADDDARLARCEEIARATGIALVACGDVHMHARARRRVLDTLSAIRLGTTLNAAGSALYANSERYLRPLARLAQRYPPELLAQTLIIAEQCNFSLGDLRYEYPEEIVPPGTTPAAHLRKLTYEGMCERYRRPGISAKLQGDKRLDDAASWVEVADAEGKPVRVPHRVVAIVEKELALIAALRYEAFFLTVRDIVKFARTQRILCQGRGSAANSAVCYCLGITEVDPARMQVLFERFISKERDEAPDIDVDFEHERREEVIQYIYKKYGRERTALAATLITYRPRSALRDVGKALGLSLDQVDQLARNFQWWDDSVAHERVREAGLDPENPTIKNVIALSRALLGFPRHLSQHVGGFIIARDQLSRLVPIENAAMPERTVIQWDKDDLEALGLLKVDVLGLGMLSAIRRTLAALNAFTGGDMQVGGIPPEDPRVYDMICAADTIGVFQIESRAQMSMLPRLQPRCFYDLVIEVAIVRPGPIQGGMVHPYLRRRRGLESVTYPSKAVEKVLERTLGVSIFQEQVMQLAMVAAGFTAGEADQLRRAMAAWKRKGGLEPFRDKLLAGMLARGYAADYAEQLFRQIQGFGEYGFPESHAASFALLAYVSSWLKCHQPAAFTCGLLNAQPLGFYAPSQLVQDAQRHGVEVRAVDVTVSGWDCVLERSGQAAALRLGLRMVKGLSEQAAQRIVAARAQGAFADIGDLAARARLDQGDLNALARADALRALAGHRRDAYWATLGIERAVERIAVRGKGAALALGRAGDSSQAELLPPSEAHDIVMDYAALGLTLRRHPLALLRPRLKGAASAQQVKSAPTGQRLRVSGIVTCRQRPDTASGVIFVTLEDETGYTNVVVWPRLVERQRKELLAARLLTVYGKIERDGEVVHLIAGRLVDDSALLGKLDTQSRDFH